MIIGLITPADTSCLANPGWHLITAGIRWLVRQAVSDASFIIIDMLRDDAEQWAAAMRCDALLLCGNPRFSLSDGDPWWECGIWQRLLAAQMAGVRVIDAWAGACYPHAEPYPDLDEMAGRIEALPRNQAALQVARQLTGVIVRDALALRIYQRAGIPAKLLPCSSWWAKREYRVKSDYLFHAGAPPNALVLTSLEGHDWAPETLRLLPQMIAASHHGRGWAVMQIATTWRDYVWARGAGLDPRLITDPESLLRIYARCNAVASFRVHASIPAASVGCAVATLAIDSRANALEQFDHLPWQPFTSLTDPEFALLFQIGARPKSSAAIHTLRRMLTC